ncbi:MAG: crossover junction endodeoxyribonuclease RuvC [Desulfovibrionaceae bacterium]
MNDTRYILGIDPGSRHTGFAFVDVSTSALSLLECGRISPKQEYSFPQKLGYIFSALEQKIAQYNPILASIEDVHVAHNVRSALKLGQARGAVVALCASKGIPIFECTPTLVKKAISSYGAADKKQIAFMVKCYFTNSDSITEKTSADATDAIAIALCAYHNSPMFSRLSGL